jgi:stage IV sporulation protein FB
LFKLEQLKGLPKRRKNQRNGVKIAVHPLFWVFGIYFCLKGELFVFLLITLAALEHECAHAFAAAKRGYALQKIVLMPYGAVVRGDIGGISLQDEIFVALAGPLASGFTALGFVALWWLFPEAYPFTDSAAYACASLAVVNLLPAHPLDGGRVLFCILAKFIPKTRAWVACRIISSVFCLLLLAGFVWTVVGGNMNLSLLFFALFLGIGCAEGKKYGYDRLHFDLSANLKRGMEERRVAVAADCPLQKMIPLLSQEKYLVVDVFSPSGEPMAAVRQERLCRWLETEPLQKTLGELVREQLQERPQEQAKDLPRGLS